MTSGSQILQWGHCTSYSVIMGFPLDWICPKLLLCRRKPVGRWAGGPVARPGSRIATQRQRSDAAVWQRGSILETVVPERCRQVGALLVSCAFSARNRGAHTKNVKALIDERKMIHKQMSRACPRVG